VRRIKKELRQIGGHQRQKKNMEKGVRRGKGGMDEQKSRASEIREER
jgi:hypothetical protein